MKFRKRPIEIEALPYTEWREMPARYQFYFRETAVYGPQIVEVYNRLHDSWIKVRPGDWVNVSNINDLYVIDGSYFHDHYEEI